MKYQPTPCELVMPKGLRNYETWARHKELIELALSRYLQKPNDAYREHLEQALRIYRDGYERQAFYPPTGAVYKPDNSPPEAYQFRGK